MQPLASRIRFNPEEQPMAYTLALGIRERPRIELTSLFDVRSPLQDSLGNNQLF